jgi:hypothetical protein
MQSGEEESVVPERVIRIRVRNTLYFWVQGFGAHMSQFWEVFLVDKKTTIPPSVNDKELQGAITDFVILHEHDINNKMHNGGEWDGAFYKILEVAAVVMKGDDTDTNGVKAQDCKWKRATEGSEVLSTDCLQAYKAAPDWKSEYNNKFDHTSTIDITTAMPGAVLIPVDEVRVLQETMSNIVLSSLL